MAVVPYRSSATWKPSPGATTLTAAATAADVQAALDADPAMVPGSPGYDNVRVTGNAGGPYTVTFVGTLAGLNVPQLVPTGATAGTTQNGGAFGMTLVEIAAEDQRGCAGQDLRVGRHIELTVDQHAQRLARRIDGTHGHARIVLPHGADARQNRRRAGAHE